MQSQYKIQNCELVDVEKLIPNPKNPNNHPDKQIDMLAKILDFQGQRLPIVVSNRSGFIVAGHGRLEAIKKLGWDKAAVSYQDFENEAQEYAHMIADNKIAELAKHDDSMMIDEIKELGIDDFELLGMDDFELPLEADPSKDAIEDDVPTDVETRCKPGDLWLLGEHRLLCGDSTNIQHVERLMGGEKAHLIHTDPPYGIGYGGSMKLGSEKFGWKQHKGGWDEERPSKDFFDMLSVLCQYQIIWGGNYFADTLPAKMGWLIWDKGQRGFSLADGEMAWTSFDHAMRIKEFARAKANKEERFHATQKPIDIIKWAFDYADRCMKKKPKNILDLFGGSGSTLIACEKTGRKCYMMELDPHYCDVILSRWEKYSGKEAVLDGQTE